MFNNSMYKTINMLRRFCILSIFIGTISGVNLSGFLQSFLTDDRGYIVKIGDPCPNFDLEFPDGSTTSLKQLLGEVIMLQFTASWCSVCRKEMPHIEEEIWHPYQNVGLKLIGIDLDEPRDVVEIFAKEMGITYPLALDSGGVVFHKFADVNAGVTRNIIINPKGEIVFLTRLFDLQEFNEMKDIIHLELKHKISSDIMFLEQKLERLDNFISGGHHSQSELEDLRRQVKSVKSNLDIALVKRHRFEAIKLD